MTHTTVKNCADCPFSRPLDGDRHVCTNAVTANNVVRGHWAVGTDCLDAIAKEVK